MSHETIYKCLFIQARNVLKKELCRHLRTGRSVRRGRKSSIRGQSRGCIVDAISIRERPAEIDDRAIPGHWEGDLLAGSKNSHIATLVERHSRFVVLVKTSGRDTQSVVSALIREAKRLPKHLMSSLTWDRGLEMASHANFTIATGAQVYFCDPRSPWQRGSNENTNGLLRQYYPKGKDLSMITQTELDRVAYQLNGRPRQTLDWMTPAERLSRTVAMTG